MSSMNLTLGMADALVLAIPSVMEVMSKDVSSDSFLSAASLDILGMIGWIVVL